MKKKVLFLILFFSSTNLLLSQQTASGKVLTSNGQVLEGIEIKLDNSKRKAYTDSTGFFEIRISRKTKALICKSPGFATKRVKLKKTQGLEIFLHKIENKQINIFGQEMVTMGLANSRFSLDTSAFDIIGRGTIFEVLQGRVPGLHMTRSSNQVEGAYQFSLRGHNSIHFSSAPLIIIDGFPIDNSVDSYEFNETPSSNRAMDIDPADIVALSILKGGTASALYGVRGANGAIILQTKKSTSPKLQVQYTYTGAVEQPNRLPETTNAFSRGVNGAYRSVTHRSWGQAYATKPVFPPGSLVDLDGDGANELREGQLIPLHKDNFKRFWRTGFTQKHHLSAAKSYRRGHFYAAFSQFYQQGLLANQDYDRTNLLLSGQHRPLDNFSIGYRINYIRAAGTRFRQSDGVFAGLSHWPHLWDVKTYPWKNEEGAPAWFSQSVAHPFWVLEEEGEDWQIDRFIGGLNIEWKLSERLHVNLNTGLDTYIDDRIEIRPIGSVETDRNLGDITLNAFEQFDWNTNLILSGTDKIGSSIKLNYLLGFNFYSSRSDDQFSRGFSFVEPNLNFLSNTENQLSANVSQTEVILGYFGQAMLTLKEAFELDLSLRQDQVQYLQPENRTFYSTSTRFSWKLDDRLNLPRISLARLHLAFATTGFMPSEVAARNTYQRLNPMVFDQLGARTASMLNSRDLRPERSTDLEVGTSIHLFNQQLGFMINAYHRTTTDQIIIGQPTLDTSFVNIAKNSATLRNRGIELYINSPLGIQFGKVQWLPALNFTLNRGKITQLEDPGPFDSPGRQWDASGAQAQLIAVEGMPFGAIYGNYYQRFGPLEPDDSGFLDQSLVIIEGLPVRLNQTTRLGNVLPKWILGLESRLIYKRFSLGFLLEHKRGGDVLNATLGSLTTLGIAKQTETRFYEATNPFANATKVFDGLDGNGLPNEIEGALTEQYWTNNWARVAENLLMDASWWRIRYLYLSYNLRLRKLKIIDRATLSLMARNLLLFTNYSGMDPEANAFGPASIPGLDAASIPASSTLELNLKINF